MRVAFLVTGSNETAEDIVQEVFARCADRLAGLDHPASYLRAAVVNACRSHHRRLRLAERLASGRRPESIELPNELVELRDALLMLADRQRAAVVLRFLCDLSDDEIAEALGCQPATVRSLVHRGLARLREVIP
jgi:RNA polymerase sigma factor (sigma-70 family)